MYFTGLVAVVHVQYTSASKEGMKRRLKGDPGLLELQQVATDKKHVKPLAKRQGPPGSVGPPGTPPSPTTSLPKGTLPSSNKGQKGQKGEAGPPGFPGQDGDRGEDGRPGSDGKDGRKGMQGLNGPKGDKGAKGEQGRIGLQGLQGPPGPVTTPQLRNDGLLTPLPPSKHKQLRLMTVIMIFFLFLT